VGDEISHLEDKWVVQSGSKSTTAWLVPPFDVAAPIPYALHQTSRLPLGRQAALARLSWLENDPSINMLVEDDESAENFIHRVYGDEVLAIYQSFPLPVMRADFWRYAKIYAEGGVYGDIDTELLRPLNRWFPPTVIKGEAGPPDPSVYENLDWDDCAMVVGLENNVHLCQWVFVANPGHPLLRAVLEEIILRAKDGIDTSDPNFVHRYTGPGVFTTGITQGLGFSCDSSSSSSSSSSSTSGDPCHGFSGQEHARQLLELVWSDPDVSKRAREVGLCIVPQSFFAGDHATNVRNMYGSLTFNDGTNEKWVDQAKIIQHTGKTAVAHPKIHEQ